MHVRRIGFVVLFLTACAAAPPNEAHVLPFRDVLADAARFNHQRLTVRAVLVQSSLGSTLFAPGCPRSESADFVLSPLVFANSPGAVRTLRKMVRDTPHSWSGNVMIVKTEEATVVMTGVFEMSECPAEKPFSEPVTIDDLRREMCQRYRFIATSIEEIEVSPDSELICGE